MPHVFVPRESTGSEPRVACTPETTKRLVKEGFSVSVESGAGLGSHFSDDAYKQQGAEIVTAADQGYAKADIVVRVAPPSAQDARAMKQGTVLVGFVSPHANLDAVAALQAQKVSTLAMELVPRISRAQSMDALSSQASIGGYKAVLLAATHLDKYFPLLMTAAGTIQPAKIVIMGAGVAGLQAIATAKRLGAVVDVSDIRPAVKEQVESLGGRFIDFPMDESGEGEGGYAKELTADQLKAQQAVVRKKIVAADVVITTALIPGRPAPKLITADMVQDMRAGAVIVDMAVSQGGNCELSESGKTVVAHGVTIIGQSNLPATVPADASLMYARNVLALVLHIAKGAELKLDLEDDIVKGAILTHQGEVLHARTAEAMK